MKICSLYLGFHLYFCIVVRVVVQLHMQAASLQHPLACCWYNPKYQGKSRRRSSLSEKHQPCQRQINIIYQIIYLKLQKGDDIGTGEEGIFSISTKTCIMAEQHCLSRTHDVMCNAMLYSKR